MAKRKWNWKYRYYIANIMNPHDFARLIRFCECHFGPDQGDYNDRWDWSAPIRQHRVHGRTRSNVSLFFKNQEDHVLFKLTYNPELLYG